MTVGIQGVDSPGQSGGGGLGHGNGGAGGNGGITAGGGERSNPGGTGGATRMAKLALAKIIQLPA
ncbi:MAG: hypothetical protein ACI9I4_001259 [Neolewinella sp.]